MTIKLNVFVLQKLYVITLRTGVDTYIGLATVGGVCSEKYSCVIAEFGSTDKLGKPYPSAGFTSVYILAHEIGHR